jgi:hypothetical protein
MEYILYSNGLMWIKKKWKCNYNLIVFSFFPYFIPGWDVALWRLKQYNRHVVGACYQRTMGTQRRWPGRVLVLGQKFAPPPGPNRWRSFVLIWQLSVNLGQTKPLQHTRRRETLSSRSPSPLFYDMSLSRGKRHSTGDEDGREMGVPPRASSTTRAWTRYRQ